MSFNAHKSCSQTSNPDLDHAKKPPVTRWLSDDAGALFDLNEYGEVFGTFAQCFYPHGGSQSL